MEQTVFWITILLLIVAAYYSLVVFPKQRDFSKRQRYVMSLQEGDEVITHSGIIGKIITLDDDIGVARLELADGVQVRIITAAILGPYDPEEIERNAQMGLGKLYEQESEAR